MNVTAEQEPFHVANSQPRQGIVAGVERGKAHNHPARCPQVLVATPEEGDRRFSPRLLKGSNGAPGRPRGFFSMSHSVHHRRHCAERRNLNPMVISRLSLAP